jgi:hypothetical protein
MFLPAILGSMENTSDNTVTVNVDRFVKLMLAVDSLAAMSNPNIATLSDELEEIRNAEWLKAAIFLFSRSDIVNPRGEIL